MHRQNLENGIHEISITVLEKTLPTQDVFRKVHASLFFRVFISEERQDWTHILQAFSWFSKNGRQTFLALK